MRKLIKRLDNLLQLTEMSMAWVDTNAARCVWVENPNTHVNDYFKYFNSFSYHKADGVARISLVKPEYIHHRNADGKKVWKLTSSDKKQLVKLMNSPSEVHKGYTRWQATLIQYNFDNFYISPIDTMEGTFDKNKFPDAFDINYPMPDYTKLP